MWAGKVGTRRLNCFDVGFMSQFLRIINAEMYSLAFDVHLGSEPRP